MYQLNTSILLSIFLQFPIPRICRCFCISRLYRELRKRRKSKVKGPIRRAQKGNAKKKTRGKAKHKEQKKIQENNKKPPKPIYREEGKHSEEPRRGGPAKISDGERRHQVLKKRRRSLKIRH